MKPFSATQVVGKNTRLQPKGRLPKERLLKRRTHNSGTVEPGATVGFLILSCKDHFYSTELNLDQQVF